jgi:hypothetical protein
LKNYKDGLSALRFNSPVGIGRVGLVVALHILDLAECIRTDIEADIEAALDARSSAQAERLIYLRKKLHEVEALIATLNAHLASPD